LAQSEKICAEVSYVLLASEEKTGVVEEVLILKDAFAMADDEVRAALEPVLKRLQQSYPIRQIMMEDVFGFEVTFHAIRQVYCTIQWAEVWSS